MAYCVEEEIESSIKFIIQQKGGDQCYKQSKNIKKTTKLPRFQRVNMFINK